MRAFIVILMMTIATQAVAVSGSMRCTVKSNHIAEITEGKSKTYSHYTDGIRVGDNIDIEYEASHLKDSLIKDVSFQLYSSDRDRNLFFAKPVGDDWRGPEIRQLGKLISATDAFQKIYTTEDLISVISAKFGRVELKRYYKNDWHGLAVGTISVTKSSTIQTQIYTFDCRHTVDNYGAFRKKIMSFKND